MNMRQYLKSYRGLVSSQRLLTGAVIILGLGNLVQAVTASERDHTFVLVPPYLDKEQEIQARGASPEYLTSWGLYFANLIGNVTPGRLTFIKSSIEPFLSPEIYQQVMQRLELEADHIKRDQIALAFTAQQVFYDKKKNRVIVGGQSTVTAAVGGGRSTLRTYEFVVDIIAYRPVIRSMDTYEGAPKIQEASN